MHVYSIVGIMLDYCSEMPSPPLESKVTDMIQNVGNNPVTKNVESMARDIAKHSKEYSYSGYAVFGRHENIRALQVRIDALQSNLKMLQSIVLCVVFVAKLKRAACSFPNGHTYMRLEKHYLNQSEQLKV